MTCPKRKNGITVVRLVVSFREGGKKKTKIVKTIGQSKDPEIIEQLKRTAQEIIDKEKKGLIQITGAVPNKIPVDLLDISSKERRNNGFDDILGSTYQQLGFDGLIRAYASK